MAYIIEEISRGQKKVGGRNTIPTMQATVTFGDGQQPTTRHLEKHDSVWTGWNSDAMLHARAGILNSFANHGQAASAAEARVRELEAKVSELKGKKGISETRKRLREALKAAKAAESVAKSDLARVKTIADDVDKTHPEMVEFASAMEVIRRGGASVLTSRDSAIAMRA